MRTTQDTESRIGKLDGDRPRMTFWLAAEWGRDGIVAAGERIYTKCLSDYHDKLQSCAYRSPSVHSHGTCTNFRSAGSGTDCPNRVEP